MKNIEVKDWLVNEPLSYSLEENLRESLSSNLKIKSIKRKEKLFNVIIESEKKEYQIIAIKPNVIKDQWQFILGDLKLNTFSKKKLIESILRDSLPLKSKNIITQSILKEIETNKTNKGITGPGFIPSAADESYVMLILSIGCAKRSLPNLNSLAYFEDKDEQSMVDEGLRVIEGKITGEAYAKKFLSFVKKYNKDKIDPQDEAVILSQVEARIGRNKSSVVNPNMKAAAKKSVN